MNKTKKERLLILMKKRNALKKVLSLVLCLILLGTQFAGCAVEAPKTGDNTTNLIETPEKGENETNLEENKINNEPSSEADDAMENSSSTEPTEPAAPIEIPEAGNIVASGRCGSDSTWVEDGEGDSDISWTLDDQGILTISGTGEMSGTFRGKTGCTSPWYDFRENVKYIVVEEGVTLISDLAFYECSNALVASLPTSVYGIGLGAFTKCESLEKLVISEGTRSIGGDAFFRCKNLSTISLPDSVEYVGQNAFARTGYAEDSQNWEDGILYLGSFVLASDESLSGSHRIKEGTTFISAGAFWERTNLTEIILPDSLKVIDEYAFTYCTGLKSIIIPQNVTTICTDAFADCGIEDITFLCNTPPDISEYAFNRLTATIHYPADWGEFPYCGDDANLTLLADAKK